MISMQNQFVTGYTDKNKLILPARINACSFVFFQNVNNEYPEVMKKEMKTSPAAEVYISGLSPESSLIK